MKKFAPFLICLCALTAGLLSGCESSGREKGKTDKPFSGLKIRLAKQYGMQYAAVYTAEKLNLIEKYLPGAEIEWSSFAGGAAMNEALIGGHLDVGFMGIPPAVIAIDKGADLKIASGVSVPPIELMAGKENIKSLGDFGDKDKIAVPGIGSIQHILLSMGAKKYLNDPHFFDNKIVAMANPDAYSSLLSGTEVSAHITTMPYLEKERAEGFRSILSGREAYGDTSIICVVSKDFHDGSPYAYAALMAALGEAIALVNGKDEKALNIIAETEKLPTELAVRYLDWDGTNYTSNIYGLAGIVSYMLEAGYIKRNLALEDLLWENALAMVGKRRGEASPAEKMLGQ